MKIMYEIEKNEGLITSIKVADALIENKVFDRNELMQIAYHLLIHCIHNKQEVGGMNE